jgi:hypothetical protein
VSCYSPRSLRALADGVLTIAKGEKWGYAFQGPFYTVAVPCHCEAGQRDWQMQRDRRPEPYSPETHCAVTALSVDEKFAEMQAWNQRAALTPKESEQFSAEAW